MRLKFRILKHVYPLTPRRPDWGWLGASSDWRDRKARAQGGVKVLVATNTGANWPCSGFDGLLGVALTLAGAEVRYLLCDGALPACQECDHQWISPAKLAKSGPQAGLCGTCFAPARAMLAGQGLPIETLGAYADAPPVADADFADLDEHARAGVLRYFGTGDVAPDEPHAARICGRYRAASDMTRRAAERLLDAFDPDVVVAHHGIYVPQGAVVEAARARGKRVVAWGPSYRRGTVLFSHGGSYHYTMPEETADDYDDFDFDADKREKIARYLESRPTGRNDWISFNRHDGEAAIFADGEREGYEKIVGLFTNVIWDAQLHFKSAAFATMLEWLFHSVDYYIERPDTCLVIRVHPAEVYGMVPSRQPVAEALARRYGELPDNIKIVPPDAAISSYRLAGDMDCALVFGTKMALELACLGIPVIVAGESWVRGKGFTIDVETPAQYAEALDSVPALPPLSQEARLKAHRYAYHLFFRRMIEVSLLHPPRFGGVYEIHADTLEAIEDCAGLTGIARSIIDDRPFIHDSESALEGGGGDVGKSRLARLYQRFQQ